MKSRKREARRRSESRSRRRNRSNLGPDRHQNPGIAIGSRIRLTNRAMINISSAYLSGFNPGFDPERGAGGWLMVSRRRVPGLVGH